MKQLLKKYWDLVSGFFTSILISVLARFDLGKIQLIYSIFILSLVSIGVFKIIKQSIENKKTKKEQKKGVIDSIVDSQKPMKAIHLAEEPMRDGEELGHLILEIKERMNMKNVKQFFKRYGFYILSALLLVLGTMEYFFGFLNNLFGNKFAINGISLIPIVLLLVANIFGSIATPVKREKKAKEKKVSNEYVKVALKKALKEANEQLVLAEKAFVVKRDELESLRKNHSKAEEELKAAKEVFNLNLGLYKEEDIRNLECKKDTMDLQIEERIKETEDAFKTKELLKNKINTLKKQIKEA